MIPSIKGYAFLPIVRQVQSLVETGVIKDLETLSHEALDFLETEPAPTLWYPITVHDELLRLLRDVAGGGDDLFLREHGFNGAAEILETRSVSVILAGARVLRLRTGFTLVRMAQLVLNFGEWSFDGPGLHDFTIRAADVAPLPDSVRAHTEGFIGQVATRVAGREVACTSSRPTPDVILFRGIASDVSG